MFFWDVSAHTAAAATEKVQSCRKSLLRNSVSCKSSYQSIPYCSISSQLPQYQSCSSDDLFLSPNPLFSFWCFKWPFKLSPLHLCLHLQPHPNLYLQLHYFCINKKGGDERSSATMHLIGSPKTWTEEGCHSHWPTDLINWQRTVKPAEGFWGVDGSIKTSCNYMPRRMPL